MAYQYVVKHPFGPYQIGDHITDPEDAFKWSQSHPEFLTRKWIDETESAPRVPPPATPAEQPVRAGIAAGEPTMGGPPPPAGPKTP